MPTYAEIARDRDLAARRKRQDAYLAETSRQFDAQVRANTDKRGGWKAMKYERAGFAVVTASDAYRAGYDRIHWGKDRSS